MEILRKNVGKYAVIGAVGILILVWAVCSDFSGNLLSEDGTIERSPAGGDPKELDLTLNADGIAENYTYHLTVEPERVTEEMAQEYFQEAAEEIDEDFFSSGDTADHTVHSVSMKDTYADGMVSAEWILDDYTYVSPEGDLITDELSDDGSVVEAQVLLSCEDYKQEYNFSFIVYPQQLNQQETFLKNLDEAIQAEMDASGTRVLHLPQTLSGISLQWKEKKSYLAIRIFFFEILICLLLKIAEAERKQEAVKKRKEMMELEYSEVVSKLSILMGSGMTLKSAWERIASRYLNDRKNAGFSEKPSYEEMVITMRSVRDGESERAAYQKFGERCNVPCYYKLSRILVQNLEKGNKELCSLLEKEAEQSFEDRKLYARKKGEEAGTKMLLPLMLMMVIVIAIIIVPAIISFNS